MGMYPRWETQRLEGGCTESLTQSEYLDDGNGDGRIDLLNEQYRNRCELVICESGAG
jgi:hypothetical protein